MKLPSARNRNIIEQELGGELLVYDLTTNKAYTLNETLRAVYKACDGRTSFDELKRRYQFCDDLIYLALDELKQNNLLKDTDYASSLINLSRREAIRKVGLTSMIMLPLISSLVAPTAAMAASGGTQTYNQACTTDQQCASSAPYCRNLDNGQQVCCRRQSALFATGAPANSTIYANCGLCPASQSNSFCCSNAESLSSCASIGNGTVSCNYSCS